MNVPFPKLGSASAAFARDVKAGLAKPQKELLSKYLYDAIGSELFEAITLLPEYGVSRAESRLLRRHAGEIVGEAPNPISVVELGSGTGKKTRWILEALSAIQKTNYYPIDISATALARSHFELEHIPFVTMVGFEREYLEGLAEVVAGRQAGEELLVLFLGSSIGNFDRPAGEAFLRRVRALLMPGDRLLLGMDLEKPATQLELAYDDPLGVTAAFDLNILARINRELGGTFDLANFEHVAIFNSAKRRIEMHLRARAAHWVEIVQAGISVDFREGETIWTESCHKFHPAEIEGIARRSGFGFAGQWIDEEWAFSDSLWVVGR